MAFNCAQWGQNAEPGLGCTEGPWVLAWLDTERWIWNHGFMNLFRRAKPSPRCL